MADRARRTWRVDGDATPPVEHPFKIDFHEYGVRMWERDGADLREVLVTGYTPTLYATGDEQALATLERWAADQRAVEGFDREPHHLSLDADDRTSTLAIRLHHADDPGSLAGRIRREVELPEWTPGRLRLYNVDLAPQFRFCLETDIAPAGGTDLRTLAIELDEKSVADGTVAAATVDGEPVDGGEPAVLRAIATALERTDPDVLVLNTGALVPLVTERALAHDVPLQLGRRPGWTRLAGDNTYESYGQVGHAAARFDVPGRVLLDTSNSFLWGESSLAGLAALVEASHKPLQETAWGSIGTIFTSIQIREATERDVLIPWNKWTPETFKDVRQLHDADRGGFIMDPDVGFHEDVSELDFSSLYPYIMCRYNISPDTILCACHADRADIPGLGYNVCDERGFLVDVLEPLLERREKAKAAIRAADDEDAVRDERAISGAIKWVLVSCFGYQGYRNAKFGRIECHEAINAVAREIFLRSKRRLESHGWRVVHGIVDSIWVTATDEDPTALDDVVEEITADVGITLDHEADYDWVAFVPRRGSDRGALTKYVARRPDGSFKLRGIEARQRSTPPFVVEAQRDLLETLDRTRDPAAVVDRARRHARRLRDGAVPPDELLITRRVSKPVEEYTQETVAVAALRRTIEAGVPKRPGESVRFVVVDDGASGPARVRLPFESPAGYDADYYARVLWRAAESVVSPLGWDEERIERHRRGTVDGSLAAFGS